MKHWKFALAGGLAALALNSAVLAQDTPVTQRDAAPDPTAVQLVEVATGFNRPLFATHAGDASGRLFIVEQGGLIHILQDGAVLETPFLDVAGLLSSDVFGGGYSERGLLGLAFHPDYETNGQFYIYYTDRDGNSVLAAYSVSSDPNVADPNSARIVLTQDQPYPNHNGGHLSFGPDGYLYVAFGDGGAAGDPENRAQDPSTWLGKLVRIDVNTEPYAVPEDNPFVGSSDTLPEIWALGLRNPWRFSFDAATGDLYVADVGQNAYEEVNFEPAGSGGGMNYGWKLFEATHLYSGQPDPANFLMPFYEYSHRFGISVSGGYVYRGETLPDLQGVYFFGDFGSGNIWASYRDSSDTWQTIEFLTNTGLSVSSFGQDEANELYVVDYSGRVLQFAAAN